MEGEGRNIHELAPEVVNETRERITDAYIDQILLHHDADQTKVALLEKNKGACTERIARLETVRPQIELFLETVKEKFPEGMGERRRIFESLALMLKVHINQKERVATDFPFISHPLAVTQRVLEMYDGHDASFVVSAGLLHDSIEDQSRLLALEKQLAHEEQFHVSEQQVERAGALMSLGHFFGMRVMELVRALTSPPELKMSEYTQEQKNALYLEYIKGIFLNEHEQIASVVKWADLQENAFIKDLFDKAHMERQAGHTEKYEEAIQLYFKLKGKYEPALRFVRDFFEKIPAEHPLFSQREVAIEKIDDALANQYTLA